MSPALLFLAFCCFTVSTVTGHSSYGRYGYSSYSHGRYRPYSTGCSWYHGWYSRCVGCNRDTDCSEPKPICSPYTRECSACFPENEVCTADKHCCEDLLCENRKCARAKPAGTEGARCKANDCGDNLCCRKNSDGEGSVCKKLGDKGECCSVSGSHSFYCPCRDGFTCKAQESGGSRWFWGYWWRSHRNRALGTCVSEPTEEPTEEPTALLLNKFEMITESASGEGAEGATTKTEKDLHRERIAAKEKKQEEIDEKRRMNEEGA